jgi:membrane-associated phospholipid phosphatase
MMSRMMTSSARAGRQGPDFWRKLRPFAAGAVCTLALVIVSVAYLDRPWAFYAHSALAGFPLRRLTRIPELLGTGAIIAVIVLGLARVAGRARSGIGHVIFIAAVSFCVAFTIKDALKLSFGRTWPETWVHDNPSLIVNGVYGFFPFHGGEGWASFPSGHMTVVCSIVGVMWAAWPRARVLLALLPVATAIGLLGADYHFIGDVLAGSALGLGVAAATVRVVGI